MVCRALAPGMLGVPWLTMPVTRGAERFEVQPHEVLAHVAWSWTCRRAPPPRRTRRSATAAQRRERTRRPRRAPPRSAPAALALPLHGVAAEVVREQHQVALDGDGARLEVGVVVE